MVTELDYNLDFIENYLVENYQITADPTLQTGRFGTVLYLYAAAAATKNEETQKKADAILAGVFKQTVGYKLSSFHTLSAPGIYWGICYLVNKGYLHLNVDDLFGDIDDAYSTQLQQHQHLFLKLNLSSLTIFLIERLKCAHTKKGRVMVQKALIDMVDLIEEKMNLLNLALNELCSYHFLLSEILAMKIYPEITRQVLTKISAQLHDQAKNRMPEDLVTYLKVAAITGNIYPQNSFSETGDCSVFNGQQERMTIDKMYTIQLLLKDWKVPHQESADFSINFAENSVFSYADSRIRLATAQDSGLRNIGLCNDGIAALGLVLLEKLYHIPFDWKVFNYCHSDPHME